MKQPTDYADEEDFIEPTMFESLVIWSSIGIVVFGWAGLWFWLGYLTGTGGTP